MVFFALAVLTLLTLLRLRMFYPSAEYIETCGMIGVVFGIAGLTLIVLSTRPGPQYWTLKT